MHLYFRTWFLEWVELLSHAVLSLRTSLPSLWYEFGLWFVKSVGLPSIVMWGDRGEVQCCGDGLEGEDGLEFFDEEFYTIRCPDCCSCGGLESSVVPFRKKVVLVFRDIIYVINILYSWHLVICEHFWSICVKQLILSIHMMSTWFCLQNRVWQRWLLRAAKSCYRWHC
jgi:hypothetical protein